MKRIVFIDNDRLDQAQEDVDRIKDHLENIAQWPAGYIDSIELIPDLSYRMKEDDQAIYKLLFEEDCAVASWSMYTATHFGSLFQLKRFLSAAGSYRIAGRIFIDGSMQMEETLDRDLKDEKRCLSILNAIEANNIIGFDYAAKTAYRLRVELKGLWNSPFAHEKIDLKKLLST